MDKCLLTLLLLSSVFTQAQTVITKANPKPLLSSQSVFNTVAKTTTLTPCAGGTITLSAGISGSSYQWQVNDGIGFVNISNGGIYSDATTANLKITGAPTSLYGYQYRCNVNGNFSATSILKFVTAWTGAIDNNWENQNNWNCNSVPDVNTDVVINSGSPILNSVQTIRSLSPGFGVNVTVRPGARLNVNK